eukprot:CAMPEP_0196781344 /NCGR_PEP_ID=MMETSP1104-20130614/9570_1 /TAXON_ID=33652 /ORGANISM="Cafeteria sp., Strain Caron Lab Isolate" /LENGTH=215 /DNA_ID=CAMNT_0042151573 /DNA_START=18 /DNA_END=665 /DNA_ORIENTATION=+
MIKPYLLAYNLASLGGWIYVLALCVMHIAGGMTGSLWAQVELPLKIVQTAAALEIVHAVFGLVRSSPFAVFLQVWSRIYVLWFLANLTPAAQEHWSFTLMCTSWSIVELPRYTFYALKVYDKEVPSALLFLRYHLFMVLYPTGISGELGVLLSALPHIAEHQPFSWKLPNEYNAVFNFYYFNLFVLAVLYPLGGPFMYMHMWRQRQKIYAKQKSA